MTMQHIAPYAHLTAARYDAVRAAAVDAARTLLASWGAARADRAYPAHRTTRQGYRYVVAGKWSVDGRPATAAQARLLNATHVACGVASCAVDA